MGSAEVRDRAVQTFILVRAIALSQKKHFILDLSFKITQAKAMPTYDDILNQAERLRPDEQLRLIEDLAILVRRQATETSPDSIQEPPKQNLDRWFGFLPKPMDALAFQLQIRREWDREVGHEP